MAGKEEGRTMNFLLIWFLASIVVVALWHLFVPPSGDDDDNA